MNKVLSVDFSTKSTGYAFMLPNGKFVVGSVKGGSSKDPLERTKLMADSIAEVVEYHGIQDYFIAIEEPIIAQRTKGNISLVRSNGYFLSSMRERFGMGYIDIPNSKWTAYHFIKGKRELRKKASIKVLKQAKLVPIDLVNDDMADAYCILLYAINTLKEIK